jgi:bifunctional non-homologous end joining protein LigD
MELTRIAEPFDDPEWIFELKHDGFRALAYLCEGKVELVSRRANVYRQFGQLCSDLATAIPAREAVLDGEIVCLDKDGRALFTELLRRRGSPVFIAFDLLQLDGQGLRGRPLVDRKVRLRRLIPRESPCVLYLDHVVGRGRELFQLACERDLEGIVGKWKRGPYRATTPNSWVRIKNPDYSRARDRQELFDAARAR